MSVFDNLTLLTSDPFAAIHFAEGDFQQAFDSLRQIFSTPFNSLCIGAFENPRNETPNATISRGRALATADGASESGRVALLRGVYERRIA